VIRILHAVLRFAVRRPAIVFLAALGGVLLAMLVAVNMQREPAWLGPVILTCLWTAFAAVVQALRVLWHQSFPRFLVLGALIAVVGIMYYRESGDLALGALASSPLPLAAVLELLLRWLRASRGSLWLDAPVQEAPAKTAAVSVSSPGLWRRHRGGCLGALALALVFLSLFVWQLTVPGRHANATRERLRPGMTFAEIVEAAETPFDCSITPRADIVTGPSLLVITAEGDRRSLRAGNGPVRELTPADLRTELVARASELSAHRELWVWFTFRAVLPLRVSVLVKLDEKGLLMDVGPNRAWD
jgi:hypothetical protein